MIFSDYTKYCSIGAAAFTTDTSGQCYKILPVSFTTITDTDILSVCKNQGMLPATVPVKTFSDFNRIAQAINIYPSYGSIATGMHWFTSK